MRSVYEQRIAEQTEIVGRIVRGGGILAPTPKFGDVCRLLYGSKTAAQLAAIAKCDERTAKRWMRGEFEPPLVVVIAIINKMFER